MDEPLIPSSAVPSAVPSAGPPVARDDSTGKVRVRGASTYLYACVTTAAIGSFLFGYNTASIAGASLYAFDGSCTRCIR